MNLRRGFFRLGLVLAIAWLIGGAWEFRFDLLARCRANAEHGLTAMLLGYPARTTLTSQDDTEIAWCLGDGHWQLLSAQSDLPKVSNEELQRLTMPRQIMALEWMLVPPVGVLIIGYLGFWIASGFSRKNSN
jgi:hypothetical protein